MKRFLLFAAFAAAAQAQKPEVILKDVVRDVGVLKDDMNEMRKNIDAIKALVQQVLDQSSSNGTSLAKLDAGLRDRMREQEKTLVAPVAGIGGKVDSMADEFRFVRDSIAALDAKMRGLDQKMTDTNNAIKVLQAPPAPPPAGSTEPPAGVSSANLFRDAMRDKTAGNFDLAAQEFSDYLRWFGTTEDAPLAEYYVGEIYYNQKKYDEALKSFDAVLEKYPKNPKTLDSMFMKGQALVKLGNRNEGAEEFRELVKAAPSSDQANRARQELKALGLSTATTAPAAAPKKKR